MSDFAPLLYALSGFALLSVVAGCFVVALINVGRRREYLRRSLPKAKLRGAARHNFSICRNTIGIEAKRKTKKGNHERDSTQNRDRA